MLKPREGNEVNNIWCVADLINEERTGWKEDLLIALCEDDMREAVKRIELPRMVTQDKLLWTGAKDGHFLVKSCHNLLRGVDEMGETDRIWKLIWEANLHERVKLFLWRIAANTLPIKQLLKIKLGLRDSNCVLYREAEETLLHLFRECQVTRAIGFASR